MTIDEYLGALDHSSLFSSHWSCWARRSSKIRLWRVSLCDLTSLKVDSIGALLRGRSKKNLMLCLLDQPISFFFFMLPLHVPPYLAHFRILPFLPLSLWHCEHRGWMKSHDATDAHICWALDHFFENIKILENKQRKSKDCTKTNRKFGIWTLEEIL